MVDEENFVSHLLTYEEAMKRLGAIEQDVLRYAWAVFLNTLEIEEALAKGVMANEPLKPMEKDGENSTADMMGESRLRHGKSRLEWCLSHGSRR